MSSIRPIVISLLVCLPILIWSAINPAKIDIWLLEVFPIIIVYPLLFLTVSRFKFSNLAYSLITMHAIVLCIGAHYTYEQVPLFNYIQESLNLSRNYYDKVGHFVQGFVPAIITREIVIRQLHVKASKLISVIIILCCLGISAIYEILEWIVALLMGEGADAFLGMQGDIWDTQSDMLFALIGATTALLLLSKLHDRSMSSS